MDARSGRLGPPAEVVSRFWSAVREGLSQEAAGAAVVVAVSLVGSSGAMMPVVFVVVFPCVWVFLDRRRALELGPTTAVRRDVWGTRSMARSEVRSVAAGAWWVGGLKLTGAGGSMRVAVPDLPLGYVSAERVAVVQAWADPT